MLLPGGGMLLPGGGMLLPGGGMLLPGAGILVIAREVFGGAPPFTEYGTFPVEDVGVCDRAMC